MTVTVYSKPNCPQCSATIRALKARGVKHEIVDLTADEEAMIFVQELGYRQAPVVIANDQHWSGFRPDKIDNIKNL